jgi:hypothetical protein
MVLVEPGEAGGRADLCACGDKGGASLLLSAYKAVPPSYARTNKQITTNSGRMRCRATAAGKFLCSSDVRPPLSMQCAVVGWIYCRPTCEKHVYTGDNQCTNGHTSVYVSRVMQAHNAA